MSLLHSLALAAAGAVFGASVAGIVATVKIGRLQDMAREASDRADDAIETIGKLEATINRAAVTASIQALLLKRADELLATVHMPLWHDAVGRWRRNPFVKRASAGKVPS